MSEPAEIARAVAVLREGGLVAFPTETVYGLGCDAESPVALRRLFAVKRRPADHPVIVHVSSVAAIEVYAVDVSPVARALVDVFWPGPLTVVLPAAKNIPLKVTGGTGTVGIRIPDCHFTRMLMNAIDMPLIGTSANLSSHPACACAEEVLEQLGGRIELVIDGGKSQASAASTLIDLTRGTPRILREGAIPSERLKKYLSL